MPGFTTRTTLALSPDEVFASICDLSRWPDFRGAGPIPGIAEATLPEGERFAVGGRVRVRNTDGSVHHERITAFEPGRRYCVAMELVPPAAYVMETILEDVTLEPAPCGTQMTRRFELKPRLWLTWPLAWVMAHLFLKRAIDQHNASAVRAAAAVAATRG